MIKCAVKSTYTKIIILITISLFIDNIFISEINSPPAWDQGYHLSNVFKIYNIFENSNLNLTSKINQILNITDNYRGPITYFISAIFLKIFNNTYNYAYLSNQVFNVLCIISIFNIGKLIKDESTGLWASVIFTFSNLIINQRSDYLIDLSLTTFSCINLLFFTKWFLDYKEKSIYSIFSGISLALVFLTKPTGISLFIFPLITIIFKIYKNKFGILSKINEILLFNISFLLIIFPWFSKHWLTIITSILNAWNWGINYQEGLNIDSFDSYLFYFKELPSIFGVINFYIFLVIFLLEKTSLRQFYFIKIQKFKRINFIFLAYLFNCYLIVSLMSTKDIRFILPLYPLLCIYLSLFINTKISNFFTIKSKKIILIISISISLFLSNNFSLSKLISKDTKNQWPHEEIIKSIRNKNLNLTSTLAVLPDLKELNTFNLEAEASRQGEEVYVRQIVSNNETYKNDLEYFDWFLVKTGDQGIMTNESKNLLNQYLLDNKSFIVHKKWRLPDNSDVFLLRRKIINTSLVIRDCSFDSPNLSINQINNGINIKFIETGKTLKTNSLLIDYMSNGFKNFVNISLANGFIKQNLEEKSCYSLSQNISLDLPKKNSKSLIFKAKFLNNDGNTKPIEILNENLIVQDQFLNNEYIQMANRISKVELMGNYLENGKFEKLFNLVGIINQSDPQQKYLKDSEKIYIQRYKDNKDLKSLYSILISQILQKKIIESKQTVAQIIRLDSLNINAHLIKSIINIYLFDGKNARISIDNAKLLKKTNENEEIIETIDGLTYLLELKFLKAYKTLTK